MSNINVQTFPQSHNAMISAKDKIYIFKWDSAAVPGTPTDLNEIAMGLPAATTAAITTLGTSINSIYVGFQIADFYIANNNQVLKI